MGGVGLFLLSVALYAGIPLVAAALGARVRFVLLYAHIAAVLTLGGLLGAVYVLPIHGDVALLAGQVAFGGFMFSTMVTTIVGRDLQVVRNVIVMTIGVDVLVYLQFRISRTALVSDLPNPLGVDAAVFDQSLRIVVMGGILIIAELLLILGILEVAKRRLSGARMAPVYVLAYVAVVTLDGVLFPALVLLPPEGLGAFIEAGVQAKAVLAAAFAVPLVVFVAFYRPTLAAFEAAPIELRYLLVPRRDEMLAHLERQAAELDEHRRRLTRSDARTARLARVGERVAALPATAELDDLLAGVGEILGELPGVRDQPAGLVVEVESGSGAQTSFGPAERHPPTRLRLWREADAGAVVVDGGAGGPLALLPLTVDDTRAVLDVAVAGNDGIHSCDDLIDLVPHLSTLLAPGIRVARDTWHARAPLLEILERTSLYVHGQPIVDVSTGEVYAVEALARFVDGTSPADRFAEAARVGLLLELEQLALRTALAASSALPTGMTLAVNLSAGAILDPRTEGLLRSAGRPVVVEVTENEPVEDYDRVTAALRRIPDARLAVDDTGSGYSSLSHVLRLEPSIIKLDRSWVAGLDRDRPRQVLAQGMQRLAAELGSTVVAEGVEHTHELAALRELGVRYVQGFLLARPGPMEQITASVELPELSELP